MQDEVEEFSASVTGISQWTRVSEVMDVLDEYKLTYIFAGITLQPTHAETIARHFRNGSEGRRRSGTRKNLCRDHPKALDANRSCMWVSTGFRTELVDIGNEVVRPTGKHSRSGSSSSSQGSARIAQAGS